MAQSTFFLQLVLPCERFPTAIPVRLKEVCCPPRLFLQRYRQVLLTPVGACPKPPGHRPFSRLPNGTHRFEAQYRCRILNSGSSRRTRFRGNVFLLLEIFIPTSRYPGHGPDLGVADFSEAELLGDFRQVFQRMGQAGRIKVRL